MIGLMITLALTVFFYTIYCITNSKQGDLTYCKGCLCENCKFVKNCDIRQTICRLCSKSDSLKKINDCEMFKAVEQPQDNSIYTYCKNCKNSRHDYSCKSKDNCFEGDCFEDRRN